MLSGNYGALQFTIDSRKNLNNIFPISSRDETQVMKYFYTALVILLLTGTAMSQSPIITYTLEMSKPWTHFFEVEVRFEKLSEKDAAIDFLLPVWRSGRYIIFDFAGSVQEFHALDQSQKPLRWEKTDKSTWRVAKGTSTSVSIRYKVFANEFSMRTKGLNDEGGFLDGSAAFMYVEKYRYQPLTLIVKQYTTWHVTTGLDSVGGDPFRFTAPNYDHLIDCPLFLGNQKDFDFEVEGTKHVLSIMGEGNFKDEDLIEDLKTIVKTHKEFWGGLPYQRYVFMVYLSTLGGGGTEHINSTIMGARPFIFSQPRSYKNFLGLVAHEYFHTWNVKQIRPRGIVPYDFTKENYVKELWIAEGTTSYYGPRMLKRGGFITPKEYLQGLPAQVVGDRQRFGNTIQSLTESSFDAWVKYWKSNRQGYNSEADYYDKGSDVSLLLDLEIRHRSGNKFSLDDAMRLLYKKFPFNSKGYTVDDFQKICEQLAGSSLKQFFVDAVHGTKPLEWERGFLYAGLQLTSIESKDPYLGIQVSDRGDGLMVSRVVAGSPAYDAGINVGDLILAVNGFRVRESDFNARINDLKPTDPVRITLFRNDNLREFEILLGKPPVPQYKIEQVQEPTPLQKVIYESWVGAKWEGENTK